MEKNLQFYFFSSRMATRFHIAKHLLAQGWSQATTADEALFSDLNLTLNDEVSQHFEYKHLLANLVTKFGGDFMPITYCVDDHNVEQVLAKITYDHYIVNNRYEKNIKNLKWIVKPSMLNNGDQIKLFNNVEELRAHFANPDRLGGDHVIQQYIPDPDLIEGRKYTFRVSAIVTNYAGVFFNKQGYINISAHPFDLEDGFKNRKVHITNYVLDGEFANIEQRSTTVLANFPAVYQQMCAIVRQCMNGLLKIAPDYLKLRDKKIFEIFGFDFMLDQKGKVWLLEINQAPDAPTFEENRLDEILWNVFWQDIIDEFVLAIALDVAPKHQYAHFTQLLTKAQSYSWMNNLIFRCKRIFS